MAMTGEHYLSQLQALLPPGFAWSRDPEASLTALLRALAEELARLDARGEVLLSETDPRRTVELLSDWERAAGLPDPCTGPLETVQQRQDALSVKLTGLGAQDRAFFVSVAATLGYTITLTEFRVATATTLAAGDALGVPGSEFVWRVNAPTESIRPFLVGRSAAGEPLRAWGNALLECAISRLAPAHTNILFGYGG